MTEIHTGLRPGAARRRTALRSSRKISPHITENERPQGRIAVKISLIVSSFVIRRADRLSPNQEGFAGKTKHFNGLLLNFGVF